MHYKHKLTKMWRQDSATVESLLDVVADFCADLGGRIELNPDIYDTAGKIFACIGILQKPDTEVETIADLSKRIEALEADYIDRQGDGR